MTSSLRRVVLALMSLGLLLGAAVVPASASRRPPAPSDPNFNVRPGAMGSDPLRAGRIYRGDFPDPMVVRGRDQYFAYATTIANKNLPVLTSTDLVTWRALPVRRGGADPDALPYAARWSHWTNINGRHVAPTWAPTVAWMGHHWVEAYATQLANRSRFCISTAYAPHPTGVFVDRSQRPLVCPRQEAAIDPYLWRSGGRNWLLYKTEGIPSRHIPARLWIRQLNYNATAFTPKSQRILLLTADPTSWEGSTIENPAMIRYAGHYYLFYSGNYWASTKYAVGYATCQGPTGPCTRVAPDSRLIRSTGRIAGPGGATPFLDRDGRLRLTYHAWTKDHVGYPRTAACRNTTQGCPQRRMKIAHLAVRPNGLLRVLHLTAG